MNFTLFSYRPRLGVTLHKVVMAGALYLLFSGMEGVLRVTGVSSCLNFSVCHRSFTCTLRKSQGYAEKREQR